MKLIVLSSGNTAINTDHVRRFYIDKIEGSPYAIFADSTCLSEFADYKKCKAEFNKLVEFLSGLGGVYKAEDKI